MTLTLKNLALSDSCLSRKNHRQLRDQTKWSPSNRKTTQKQNLRYSSQPLYNTYEDNEHFYLHLALPGWKKSEIQILVDGGYLVINSISEENEINRKYRLKEFSKSKFNKKFTLPEAADQSSISASMEKGVLIVRIAKMEEVQVKQINIT